MYNILRWSVPIFFLMDQSLINDVIMINMMCLTPASRHTGPSPLTAQRAVNILHALYFILHVSILPSSITFHHHVQYYYRIFSIVVRTVWSRVCVCVCVCFLVTVSVNRSRSSVGQSQQPTPPRPEGLGVPPRINDLQQPQVPPPPPPLLSSSSSLIPSPPLLYLSSPLLYLSSTSPLFLFSHSLLLSSHLLSLCSDFPPAHQMALLYCWCRQQSQWLELILHSCTRAVLQYRR